MRKVMWGLLGSSVMVAVPAMAEEAASEANELEKVSVWATEVTASSVHMDEQAMTTRQADHISDLLRTVPGVDVGGAHSLNQRITIRSMDDKDLRISIDGANQNTYMYHHMGNLQINADILESVDIQVGNNSVINGGLGGVVKFRTKSARDLLMPGDSFGVLGKGTYSTNAYESASLTGFGTLGDSADYLAYYNYLDRDNFEVGGGVIEDANGNEMPGTDGEVKGLEGELNNALVKLGWDLTSRQRLTLGFESYKDEGDYSYRPDMGLATDIAIANGINAPLTYPTEFTRDTWTLNYDATLGNTTLESTLFYNDSELERDETGLAQSTLPFIAATAGEVYGQAENTGLNLLARTWLDAGIKQELVYGAEVIRYDTRYQAQYVNGTVDESSEDAQSNAVFVEDRVHLGERVVVTPGVRYNQYKIDSVVVDDTYDDVTGAFAVDYQVMDSLKLRASTTQLFKGPEIGEVFVGAGLFDTPNPDIKAESGNNHELAADFASGDLGVDRFSAGFTVFRTNIDNYIYDNTAAGKDNVGDMHIEGYESYVGFEQGNLNVLLTYANANSDLDAFDQYAALDGARIDREQGDSISVEVDYFIAPLDLNLHWDMVNVNDLHNAVDLDGAGVDRSKEGYTVHNVSVMWLPRQVEGLTITAGVDNLFDEFYASQSSRTGETFHPVFGSLYLQDFEPGRNIKATVAYQF
ncbi:putative Fe-regulated protein B [Alcanivorax sp. MD8A]|uniref:TonB-dependent receptor domain-containing protein n=1 Tax=Alcanivorax sp. MD8A TaxID=1177157 RepID=UPI000CC4CC4C|nr:TonB-dependent receptor [Alcanivorax sp. MD8A]PNE01876.1 putative Fe-regulated protein B [Alcanivorax sp. MD8A]